MYNPRSLIAFVVCWLLVACPMPESDDPGRQPYDPDLNGWRTASWTPFTLADTVTGFAYGRVCDIDHYVAVSSGGVIAWSNNGDVWNRAGTDPNPFDAPFYAVAWGGDRFVAAADSGKIALTTDGINWIAGSIPSFGTEPVMGITWGKGMFVAVGGNANIAYSSDGIDWTNCRDAGFGSSRLNDIAFDSINGRFYIVGNDGKRGWNDDPSESTNWNFLELPTMGTPPFGRNHIRKVTVGRYGSGTGIGIVYNEWGGRRIAIATNANFGDFDADLDNFLFQNNDINGIAWGGGRAGGNFIAAGTSAMIGFWPSAEPSRQGERFWRALTFEEFGYWEITALAACNGRFFIGNIGGKIGYSK